MQCLVPVWSDTLGGIGLNKPFHPPRGGNFHQFHHAERALERVAPQSAGLRRLPYNGAESIADEMGEAHGAGGLNGVDGGGGGEVAHCPTILP